jgi:RNA polymerase sigma-32 factor
MRGAILSSRVTGRYLEEIRQWLQAEEEYVLARRWREHGDENAAQRLITSHLRLVVKIATGYRGYRLPVSELISEGNVGLMYAVKRFDPEKGCRFASYAIWWIKAAIQEYIMRSWSLVRIGTTAQQKKLFFNLRKVRSRVLALEEVLHLEQVKLIAARLGVAERDVIEMNGRLFGDLSLNEQIREDGNSGEWQDRIPDEGSEQEARLAEREEANNRTRALAQALAVLGPRERRIFETRWLMDEPLTLEQLAAEFNVSRERVRQMSAMVACMACCTFSNARASDARKRAAKPLENLAHPRELGAAFFDQLFGYHSDLSSGW